MALADRVSEEAALLAAYARGDVAAAEALMALQAPRLLRLATRMLGESAEAEDVVQEAMLRLWRTAPTWRAGGAQVSTWLYRVALNLCSDRLRRRRRLRPLAPEHDPPDEAAPVGERLTDEARRRALHSALATLPERQRQAVVLRHLEGLANPEIAAIMDMSVEAVESLTARGKRALQAALGARREELGYER